MACIGAFASVVYASHSWGEYHWARTGNPFVLKVGKNVSVAWGSHLATAADNWSASEVLDATVVPGQTNPKNCRAVNGRVEVCDSKYGNTGWLGIAQVWVSGSHITQGTVKLNNTYFNTGKYNTPAWRQFVMCQEVGHTFGLDHQDEVFDNQNLGTCMDYTNDPDGAVKGQIGNLVPNTHDFEELAAIYGHNDASGILSAGTDAASGAEIGLDNPAEWGKEVRKASDGRGSAYHRDIGHGKGVFTFVIWAQ